MAALLSAAFGSWQADGATHDLTVEIASRFGAAPLQFDALTNQTAESQLVSVTRLDFLVSNPALRLENGDWLCLTNWQAYISAREGCTSFTLAAVPAARFDAIRFLVGLTPDVNKGDPAQYPAGHPLNPDVNGLHWGWQGSYVFMALEGLWQRRSAPVLGRSTFQTAPQAPVVSAAASGARGYSFHLANQALMTVQLPVSLDLTGDQTLRLALDLKKVFADPNPIKLTEEVSTTHSRTNDPIASQLARNVETSFSVESIQPSLLGESLKGLTKALVAPDATPYRLTISSVFPRPSLPLDNPLTEQGVELGRRLFNDKRLSINNSQSCAGCHDLTAAGSDNGRRFSTGAEGKEGTRNAMPLFNLAWKSSFFWDGRAATLREQVLQPIQNPVEMHENLEHVIRKLETNNLGTADAIDYPALFAKAFGSSEINSDRIARALEQFVLTQVSHNSKFDKVIAGAASLTRQEQRGFELFNTEYDPRREQFGADCFHCHGGANFQSLPLANNGLDSEPKDLGRYEVTKRVGDKGKFAVPSLRNVAVTGPYMHDGRFTSLEEVVEHYSTGVKRSPTLDPNLAKHPDGGVPLSQQDKIALVAFLKTLTDDRFEQKQTSLASIR